MTHCIIVPNTNPALEALAFRVRHEARAQIIAEAEAEQVRARLYALCGVSPSPQAA